MAEPVGKITPNKLKFRIKPPPPHPPTGKISAYDPVTKRGTETK